MAYCLNEWHEDTDESLRGKDRIQPDAREALWWKGDAMEHREQADSSLSKSTRVMFLNLRRMKRGIEGGVLRDGIWDFAVEHDVDWVGLSDHWLVVAPGEQGKLDRSGVGCGHRQLYRSSGVQAASARGYGGTGWGGDSMLWTISQGLNRSDGPVGGTLMATRSGWTRADKELVDPRGWGRFAGRKIVGVGGRAVVILQVQGPCAGSTGAGSQWQQQLAGMAAMKKGGERVEPDPSAQFLTDLYSALEPHLMKGHHLIVGGDFNLHRDAPAARSSDRTFAGLKQWSELLNLSNAMRERGHPKINTWRKTDGEVSQETEPDHVFVSKTLVALGGAFSVGVYTGHRVNDSDHRPMVLDINLQLALGLDPGGGIESHWRRSA